MNNKTIKLKGERLNIIYKNLQSSLFSPRRTEEKKKSRAIREESLQVRKKGLHGHLLIKDF